MEILSRNFEDSKWEFLHGVFVSNSIRDSITTRRGRPVYREDKTEAQTSGLWYAVENWLKEISPAYLVAVDEQLHIRNIRTFMEFLSVKCVESLNEDRMTFGVAQKILNSYLKYLWCDCLIVAPPHCPFDGIILRGLKLPSGCEDRWTYGDERAYSQWVLAARSKAGVVPLSEWELRKYNSNTLTKPTNERFTQIQNH